MNNETPRDELSVQFIHAINSITPEDVEAFYRQEDDKVFALFSDGSNGIYDQDDDILNDDIAHACCPGNEFYDPEGDLEFATSRLKELLHWDFDIRQ